ncbi:MAG: DUF554 domain-containing protein [Thermaerobacterales bacterium]
MFTGIGTVVNLLTVITGSAVGLFLGARLPRPMIQLIMQAVGAITLLIGIQMALTAATGPAIITVLAGLVTGAAAGELLDLDGRLTRLGDRLQARLARRGQQYRRFTEGFVAASLLFCVGPMTVLGSIQDGLLGDPTLLFTKATMDGISALALSAALGIGTLFSALTILVYQGGITLTAGLMRGIMTEPIVQMITAAGGLMIVCLALNIWEITRIRVANLLPGLITAPLLEALRRLFWAG